jgi:hypothetical protein
MSIREQQTTWAPNFFADADSPPALGRIATETGRQARWSVALAIGVFAVLALASSVQAILAPELLGGIFERL